MRPGPRAFRSHSCTGCRPGDALDRPALVVKHGLDDMRRDAKAGHAARGGAPQIVEGPSRRRRLGILRRRLTHRPGSPFRSAAFAREKPDTGVPPVVEKTKPSFLSPIRGNALMIPTAASLRGISCATPFFARSFGKRQCFRRKVDFLQLRLGDLARLAPVRSNSLRDRAEGPADASNARHAMRISSSHQHAVARLFRRRRLHLAGETTTRPRRPPS